ncbi:MAG: hypothetical protein IPH89_09980 [Bacteroidetes bacterium]|nr:hypothetical protein [Bacteroidota bacterium]
MLFRITFFLFALSMLNACSDSVAKSKIISQDAPAVSKEYLFLDVELSNQ